jgi:hypothetical protein
MRCLNWSHCAVGILRLDDGWESEPDEVDAGSKGREDGVRSAFRFCVIESSTVPRDMRRKSRWELD